MFKRMRRKPPDTGRHWPHNVAIHEARQLAGDGLLFGLGVMSIPHIRLATCAGHSALIDGAEGRVSSITKTQQCPLAADCSTSGAARIDVGGGVSYAEVIP